VRGASPWKAFKIRFPWLLATIASGTAGAFLAGLYEETLARALVVAFFLALVLALAESVSIQSMTLTLQFLHTSQPTRRWYLQAARREFLIVAVWQRALMSALVISLSVAGSVIIACLAGLTIPSLLHALKWDPKIAAGPITLAVTDVGTLLLYFSLASWLL
jgi:magnesium transporter